MSEPNTESVRRGCQVCWDLAFVRAHLRGGLQADHYLDLLRENEHDPTHIERGLGVPSD